MVFVHRCWQTRAKVYIYIYMAAGWLGDQGSSANRSRPASGTCGRKRLQDDVAPVALPVWVCGMHFSGYVQDVVAAPQELINEACALHRTFGLATYLLA